MKPSEKQIKEAKAMRGHGRSIRKIHEDTGISKYWLERILADTLTPRPKREENPFHPCPRRRCPGCSAMVVTRPCVACSLKREPDRPYVGLEDKPQGLELSAEEFERLRSIRPHDAEPRPAIPHEPCLRTLHVETFNSELVLTPCAVGV